jgi:hypothetical protein
LKFLKELKDLIYINESNEDDEYVYRFDDKKIKDFNKKIKSYYHNSDWTNSYAISAKSKLEEGYSKAIGLFAGRKKIIAPYAAPRGLQFLKYSLEGKDYIIFNEKDENIINNHQTYLTKFDKKDFIELIKSNQFFYNKKNEQPEIKYISQEIINDPIKFMEDQGYKVNFVDDLKKEIERIKEDKKYKILDIEGF